MTPEQPEPRQAEVKEQMEERGNRKERRAHEAWKRRLLRKAKKLSKRI